MHLATDRKVSIAIGIATAGVMLMAAIAVRSTAKFLDDAGWVSGAHDIRTALRALDNDVDHATDAVHAFLITGDSVYVRRYRENVDSARGELARSARLMAGDSAGRRGLDSLRTVVGASADELSHTLVSLDADNDATEQTAVHIAANAALVERIEDFVYSLDEHENALLAQRASTQRLREQMVWFVVVLLAAASVGVAVAARRSIRRDLDQRSRTEAALRASEAKFAGILAMAADGIISVNERQEIVHFNRGAEAIFGYDSSDVIGRPLEFLIPERFSAAHRQRVAHFGDSTEVGHTVGAKPEIIGRRRTGEEFFAEASLSKLPTADGLLYTVVLRDVTERHRIERREHALADAGARLAAPLDFDARLAAVAQLPVPAVGDWCLLDLIEVNDVGAPTLRRIASVHPESSSNAALRTLAERGLRADSPERVIDVLRSGRSEIVPHVSSDWLEAHTQDAEELAAWRQLDSGSLLFVALRARGRIVGAMTVGAAPGGSFGLDDLSLAETLAEWGALAIDAAWYLRKAQRATAARDRVLGTVSHDLRNSIGAITMSAQSLLASSSAHDDSRRHAARNILDAAGGMQRLMGDLLDVASIEAGHLSLEMEEQAIAPVVEATREMFAERARAQGVAIHVDLPARLPLVRADGERIAQVLANLVGNALKYTGAGGTVTIDAHNGGPDVLVAVRDTGTGIPVEDAPHVFDQFWHARRTSHTRGTGLGLAIARGIVEAHHGRIWLESEVGKGSTFYFTLPTAQQVS